VLDEWPFSAGLWEMYMKRITLGVAAALFLALLMLAPVLASAQEPAVSSPAQQTAVSSTPDLDLQALFGDAGKVYMVTRRCCLDEWQPGGCPSPSRATADCTGAGCTSCGPFYCFTPGTAGTCLK
jgi:hypothetical protein